MILPRSLIKQIEEQGKKLEVKMEKGEIYIHLKVTSRSVSQTH